MAAPNPAAAPPNNPSNGGLPMPMQMQPPMPPNPNMPMPPPGFPPMGMPPPPGFPPMPGMGPPPPGFPPPGMPGMPGMPPMPFPPNMMPYPGMKSKGKGPQPIDKWVNVPPNNTVYVNNLNEKISRDETINGLREIFGQFGKVLDVVCYTKIKRCKGQAWVVMEKVDCATKAVREMQNFIFFNKPMRVAYSKNVSDATLKRDGKPIPKRERPPKKRKAKKRVMMEETVPKKKKKRKKSKDKKKASDEENEDIDIDMKSNNNNSHSHSNSNSNPNKEKKKARKNMAPPNKTLFLQNLPFDVSTEEMNRIFMNFHGFRGVNLIENKPGIGFAEFDDSFNSTNAQRSVNGYTIKGQDIIVEFAQ